MYFEQLHNQNEASGLQTNTGLQESERPFYIVSEGEQKNRAIFRSDEWNAEEEAKYMAFVEKYSNLLEGKAYGKLWAVYKAMAEFIQTRNFRQCKLYHQRKCTQFERISQMVGQYAKLNQNKLALLNEYTLALNLYISNKIKSYTSAKQRSPASSASQLEQPLPETLNKTSSEYPLELTLHQFQKRPQPIHSPKDEETMCISLFQQWSGRLNRSLIFTTFS